MNSIGNMLRGVTYGNGITASLRIVLGLLFAVSGVIKMLDPVAFGKIVETYGVLPGEIAPFAAVAVPSLELLAGGLLAAGYRIRPAALIISALLAVFVAAVGYNYARGHSFDCGCLGLARFGNHEIIGIPLLAGNVALFIVALVLFRAKRHILSLDMLMEKKELKNL